MAKFLDANGLATLWGKIKSYVYVQASHGLLGILGVKVNGTDVTPDPNDHKVNLQLNQTDINNDDHTVKDANYNTFSTAEKTKLAGIAAGAQVNVIESVSGNGLVSATTTGKAVTVSLDTDLSKYNNGTSDFQNSTQVQAAINAKITSAIRPQGTVLFSSLPNPSVDYLGFMYNVSNAFTITNKFVEYDETNPKDYPAGTNVYVVQVGTGQSAVYKYDVMAGFVDLSTYWNLAESAAGNSLTAITNTEISNITDADLQAVQPGSGDEHL